MSVENATESIGPQPGTAYGSRELADDTRQSQNQVANDAPVDVNPNAIWAREQASTLVLMGKNFEANAARFNGLFGHMAAELAKKP